MSWSTYKREWEDALDAANVQDRNVRKALLAFWRKINTLQNMYDRMSWSRVQSSTQFEEAGDMAMDVEDYYFDEYNATLEAAGLSPNSRGVNIGDYLA